MRQLRKKVVRGILDVLACPVIVGSGLVLRLLRKQGVHHLPLSRGLFRRMGWFPVRDHYYEPFFNPKPLQRPDRRDRPLKGIDFNDKAQLALLEEFRFNEELERIPLDKPASGTGYYFNNGTFRAGDAEFLYNIIRHYKPRRLVEVGSGYSTRLAAAALQANRTEDDGYECEHTCIEPFEKRLADGPVIHRSLVQEVDPRMFEALERNDILFIDSSHMIKPHGDVLCEFLDILPRLQPGVLVHVHDIFTPRDYPAEWLLDRVRFWNEQYLLEAFLCFNSAFKVIGALNYLKHHYPDKLAACSPVLARHMDQCDPGSFWLQRV